MKGKKLLILAFGALLPAGALAYTGGAAVANAADDTKMIEYSFFDDQQVVHAKLLANNIPDTVDSPTRHTMATNYQQSSMPDLYSDTASESRIVVNAPEAGTYNYDISTYNATWQLPVKVYVNSYENVTSTILSNTTWWNAKQLQYSTIPLELEKGLNVIVLQFNDWGNLVTFRLPSDLELVKFPGSGAGVYSGTDFHYSETYVENIKEDIWNPNAPLSYSYLRENSSSEYESAVYVDIENAETTKSLDFTVQVDKKSSNASSSLEVQLGLDGPIVDFPIDVPQTGKPFTVNMPSYLLEEAGFAGGNPMTLRITNGDSSQEIKLISIAESTVETPDPLGEGRRLVSGDELRSSVKINGRSLELESGNIALDWSGSGIEFNLEGKGDVIASFTSLSNSSNTRFVVEVDGGEPKYVYPTRDAVLAEDLADGKHVIRLTKTSEANGNLYELSGLYVDKDAKITPVAERDTKFLFLGASIVCGNQMGDEVGEDYYQAWGNLLTRAYDADSQVISASGRGLMQGTLGKSGWKADNTIQIRDIYKKTSYFRDADSEYDMSSFVPDAIFVNAGNNDLGVLDDFGTTVDDVAKACVEFTEELRGLYGDAKIVWLWGVGTNHGRSYGKTMQEAIEGIGDPNVAFVNADEEKDGETITGTMIQGLGGHPTQYQHDEIAEMLSASYSKLAGIEDPYVRRFDYTRFEAEDYIVGGNISNVTVENDNAGQNWSGGKYAVSLNNNGIASAEEVETHAGNLVHIEIPFEARIGGSYEIQIGYATNADARVAYAFDDEAFTNIDGLNSGDWCGGHGKYESIYVDLAKGEHTFYLTGALDYGNGWINLDYVNVIYSGDSQAAMKEALDYNAYFMEKTGEECAVSVNSGEFSHDLWLELKDEFEKLSAEARDILCSYEEFAPLRERYALIASKYGYEPFLSDSNGDYAPIGFASNIEVDDSNGELMTALGTVLLLGVLGVSAALVAKKRKKSA